MQAVETVTQTQNINRRQCSRVKPMQVLVLGLCRTGTLSTWLALQQLGYDTYHMTSIMQNPKDASMWADAFRGKYHGGTPFTRKEWDQLLGHVEATTDFPGAVFVEELTNAYPSAKVVLTLRDVDDWYVSMQKTIMSQTYSPLATLLGWIDPDVFGLGNRMVRLGFDSFFGGDFERNGKKAFLEHYEHVRRVVPAENLLEWNPKEGWTSLCEFLGKPVPDTPFPRANEGAIFQKKAQMVIWASVRRFLQRVTVYGLGVGIAVLAAKYGREAFLRG
ncbi:sulfotransferase family protein [Aspergillus melleus]|uniref:sulfotransferase family protein n=1 Tax=Aspergillus melleus TaxID=138277 RepID=UPI001E8E80FB|nr:uncharacterized protein LDX57_009657 [Aspergillus melleus]KAH8432010.1 hypothetical protein LDX57_009657 [Aspergillus melleus]